VVNFEEKIMKANVGGIDRVLRVVVGLALIGMTLAGMIGVWGWIGVVPLLTGIFGFCPAYMPFGISTCPMQKSH
jgi:fatty acid desaturase